MKRRLIVLVFLATAAVSAYVGNVLATPGSGVGTTILGKSVLDEVDLNARTIPANVWQTLIKTHGPSDLYVVDNKFALGSTTGWHSHPGPSLVLVTAGTLTNYSSADPTCAPHAYTVGESFIDPGGDSVHMVRNEGTVPAEDIAVQFLPKDAVRRIDMPEPGACNL